MKGCLQLRPEDRFTAYDALNHPYFDDIREEPPTNRPKTTATVRIDSASHSGQRFGHFNNILGPSVIAPIQGRTSRSKAIEKKQSNAGIREDLSPSPGLTNYYAHKSVRHSNKLDISRGRARE
jgi:serine/threonine protein kinase